MFWGHEIPWDADLGICSSKFFEWNCGRQFGLWKAQDNLYEFSVVFNLNLWIKLGYLNLTQPEFHGMKSCSQFTELIRWWFADHTGFYVTMNLRRAIPHLYVLSNLPRLLFACLFTNVLLVLHLRKHLIGEQLLNKKTVAHRRSVGFPPWSSGNS